jgi:hypothetical protein
VVVSGATPGGSVAVFGVSRGFNGFTPYLLRQDKVVTDGDGDGAVRLELERPLSAVHSVWTAADLTSGEVGVGAPAGTELLERALAAGAIAGDGAEVTTAVGRWAYALWVRPGADGASGVWIAVVGDGGAGDEDGAEDGSIRARLASFAPLGSEETPAPERLAAGDWIVVVDPQTLEIATGRWNG